MKIAIISGSVFDTATEYAAKICTQLQQKNFTAQHFAVHLFAEINMAKLQKFDADYYIWVVSTTGLGELPPNFVPLYQELRDNLPIELRGKQCLIIGLGSSCYDDFCNGSVLVGELIDELGMYQLLPTLKLDDCDEPVENQAKVNKLISDFLTKI